MKFLSTALMLMAIPLLARADEKPAPAKAPLKLTVTAKQTEVELDLGGKTPEEYRASINEAGKKGLRQPPPPAIELTVSITNTGKEPIQIYKAGDQVVLTYELKGKGALNVNSSLATTTDFRLPVPMELAAGKSLEFTTKSLSSGFRGFGVFSYWTEAGDYELVASFKTGFSNKPNSEEFQDITLTSEPLKLKVKEKK